MADNVVKDLRALFVDAGIRGPIYDLVDQLLEVCDGIAQAAHTDTDRVARALVRVLSGRYDLAMARFGILMVEFPGVAKGDAIMARVQLVVGQANNILSNLREGNL